MASTTQRVRVDVPPDARAILLEEWTLALDRTQAQHPPHGEDPYPVAYKHMIGLLRSLYSLLRYVPAWYLHRERSGAPMHIDVAVALAPYVSDEDVLGFSHRLVPDDPKPNTFAFPPIATPLGAVVLRTQYRLHARFRFESLESLWSSAFASPSTATHVSTASSGNSKIAMGGTPVPTPPGRVVSLDSLTFTPTLTATRRRASRSGSGSPHQYTPASSSNASPKTTPNTAASLVSFRPIRSRTDSQLSSNPISRSSFASSGLGLTIDSTAARGGIGGESPGLTRARGESYSASVRSGASTPASAGPGFEITSETPLDPVINYFRFKSALRDYTADLEHADCSRYPLAVGGLADVYRATLNDGTIVAIKRMRSDIVSEGKATKRTARELHTWSKLQHKNILDILGLALFGDKLAMISPWMGKGNIMQYVKSNKDVNRYPLIAQVVEAVVYLHGIDVVHGDLKGDNILVSDDETPKLTDFGLTMMREQTIEFSTTDAGGGTYRWMAPELIQEEGTRSKESDIYALGMTMLQIMTGELPFHEIRKNLTIINEVVSHNRRPKRPASLMQSHRDQLLWDILEHCWLREPEKRAKAEIVEASFSRLLHV